MTTDSQNHQNGLSGQGGANYSSAAWRAGDSERQRLQSLGVESGVDGNTNIYAIGIPILIFTGLCVWGVNELIAYFDIHFAYKTYLLYGTAAVSFIVGIFIRNVLLIIAGLGLAGFFLTALGMIIYHAMDLDENKESKNSPAVSEKAIIQERLEDTPSTATAPEEYKCALCSVYTVEQLSASQRKRCAELGCPLKE